MEVVQIAKKEFSAFVDSLIGKRAADIIGPVVKNGTRCSFEALDTAADLCLDFDETTQSPRKFLLPSRDPVLTYATGDPASCAPVYDERERIIIGVHPGDCAAIALYDKAYGDEPADPQYRARRCHTTIVGLYPTLPYRYRFTSSMIAPDDCYRVADLMMVDMGDDCYAIEIVTGRGKALIAKSAAMPATAKTVAAMPARKEAAPDELSLPVRRWELASALAGHDRHATFATRGDKCFSCGSCVQVCPTCICFDVRDKVDLTLSAGTRYRTWDGCTFPNFATVAGGHNFRKNAFDRLRHRLFRKTLYMQERYGITGCVGCGRCTQTCTADIASIVGMVNDIVGKGK